MFVVCKLRTSLYKGVGPDMAQTSIQPTHTKHTTHGGWRALGLGPGPQGSGPDLCGHVWAMTGPTPLDKDGRSLQKHII